MRVLSQTTWICCAIFISIIGVSLQQKTSLRLEVKPRFQHERSRRTPVKLMCTLQDGDGNRISLAGCAVRDYETNVTWDFGTGTNTISNKMNGYDIVGTYRGAGMANGDCGVELSGLRYGMYIFGCRVKPVAGGAWKYSAMMVLASDFSPTQYRLHLPEVVVSLPGHDVVLLGTAEREISQCVFLPPPDHFEIFLDSSSTSENTTQYRAWREGRRCGVTLLSVQPARSGFVYSWVSIRLPSSLSAAFMELVVAMPPVSSPRLSVNTTNATFQAGDMLHASCVVEKSLPVSNITWLLGGVVVREDNYNEAPAESEWLWNHKPQMIVQRLARRLTPEDDGKHLKCRAGHLALPYGAIDSNTHIVRVGAHTENHSQSNPVDQCKPNPCGPHSVCQVSGVYIHCFCLPRHMGSPPNCQPECDDNADCPEEKACVDSLCQDLCPGDCGNNALCRVDNHTSSCVCPEGFQGDPNTRCQEELHTEDPIPSNPVDPCKPNPCGPHSVCRVSGVYIHCSCLPRHMGSPPNCRPECDDNADCPKEKVCVDSLCQDLCPGDCGNNSLCRVDNHTSSCVCPEGFQGDPYTRCQEEPCGERHADPALISGGRDAKKGEFPWHAAIFLVQSDTTHRAICGGTLIKPNIVVTAAHCVHEQARNRLRNSTSVKVALGKLLREWEDDLNDPDVQRRDVASIHVHEYYVGHNHDYRSDIAVIKLSTNAILVPEVNVACVDWSNTFGKVQLTTGSVGTVTGWGLTFNSSEVSSTLQWIDLPWVDPITCRYHTQPYNRRYLTRDKFCAGYRDQGRSVCQGDSGGGLLFLNATNNRYYLRGVVSSSLAYNTNQEKTIAMVNAALIVLLFVGSSMCDVLNREQAERLAEVAIEDLSLALASNPRLRRSPEAYAAAVAGIRAELDKADVALADIRARLHDLSLQAATPSCQRALLDDSQLSVVRAMLTEEMKNPGNFDMLIDFMIAAILGVQQQAESPELPVELPVEVPVEVPVVEAPRAIEVPVVEDCV